MSHTHTSVRSHTDAHTRAGGCEGIHRHTHNESPENTPKPRQYSGDHADAKPPAVLVNKKRQMQKKKNTKKSLECTRASTTKCKSERRHFCPRITCSDKHALEEPHRGGGWRRGGSSGWHQATELFTDGPHCRETL